MIALSCETPGKFEFKEISLPKPTKGYALLKIKRIGICGTDYHAFEGTQPFFNYPRILGHEIAAEIIQLENEQEFRIGEKVTINPYFSCGHCIACRNAKPNCCEHISVFGVHEDGGMQEYISVPESSLIHGQDLSFDELALVEPLAIGAHGVKLSDLKAGELVLILGAGPIGLGTASLAQIAGGKVIIADYNTNRLDFCLHKLDLSHIINLSQTDMYTGLKEITGGDMPTVIIDCTGNQDAINGALKFLAHGGKLILIGLQKKEIIISHPEFHKREATMKSSRNALADDFSHVINCISKGLIHPLDFISHRVAFESLPENFEKLLNSQQSVIKALVEFD